MDWENHPFEFVLILAVTAAIGALAAHLKEVNGSGFRWRRLICRCIYRTVVAFAAGLLISTVTTDLRLLWASVLLLAVSGVGEDQLISLLPNWMRVQHEQDKRRNRN